MALRRAHGILCMWGGVGISDDISTHHDRSFACALHTRRVEKILGSALAREVHAACAREGYLPCTGTLFACICTACAWLRD